MAEHNVTGHVGEAVARRYLTDNGYDIRHRNWHFHHYELDIVAVKEDTLVVVEVKTRKTENYGRISELVSDAKMRRIVAAADAYVRFFGVDFPVRFDIMILIGQSGQYKIEHIEDAFIPPVRYTRRR